MARVRRLHSDLVAADQVNVHRLPPQLRMLVRAIGEAAAFRLVESRGGVPLTVPKRAHAEHHLAELLGPVAFAQLVDGWGGLTLELPKYDAVLRQLRHQRVHELLRRHTTTEVALMTNYTKRQVINIKQSLGPEALGQLDLFGVDQTGGDSGDEA